MNEQTEHLVLEQLRAICATLGDHSAVLHEINGRLGHLEGLYANLSQRVDRIDGDVMRIKRRLDIAEQPSG